MRHLFLIIVALFISSALYAQVHVNVNLGIQPAWGPVGHSYVENYYLPDIEVYYNVPAHRFYYFEGGRWIWRSSLPPRYRDYDLYRSHKIVINDREPWRNHVSYRDRYSDRHDSRYNKHDNGLHKGWNKGNNGNGHGNDNRNGNSHGNGNGHGNGHGNDNSHGKD